jgi:hypothetical protein
MRAVASARAEPSWGRVLVTTVRLWASWRGNQFRGYRGWLAAWRWRAAALGLALALGAAGALVFTGVFTGSASLAAGVPSAGRPVGAKTGAETKTRAGAATGAQARAAAWIASQVSANAIIACYPGMCAALQQQGVMAGRLMPLDPGDADPAGADVMVTSPSVSRQLAGEHAPALIASFGSGDTRIEVRATEPGGAAAYESALRADLAARKSAGSELLRNWRIGFTAQDVAQLRAGEVDSRLLATLAALASQYSFRVAAFGDASPGAQVPFREVTITGDGGQDAAAVLAGALAMVRAQQPPYLPAHATIRRSAGGLPGPPGPPGPPGLPAPATLSIEFAAPGPLGLLTAVLTADAQRAGVNPTRGN